MPVVVRALEVNSKIRQVKQSVELVELVSIQTKRVKQIALHAQRGYFRV